MTKTSGDLYVFIFFFARVRRCCGAGRSFIFDLNPLFVVLVDDAELFI